MALKLALCASTKTGEVQSTIRVCFGGHGRQASDGLPWAHTVFGNLKTWLRGTFPYHRLTAERTGLAEELLCPRASAEPQLFRCGAGRYPTGSGGPLR